MESATRYLTQEGKAQELASWQALCLALPPDLVHDGDTRGHPDPTMIGWCALLNSLPGVCTLQSCAGHRSADGALHAGHLWLWLSQGLSARFDGRALELAAQPGIESVSRLYTAWGQEVASIAFAGNERGLLGRSMTTILRFFRDLSSDSCGFAP